jgi:hypothetical protein
MIFITPGSSLADGGGSPLAFNTARSSKPKTSSLAWLILGVIGLGGWEATSTVTAFLPAQGQSRLNIPHRCFLPPR